MADWCTYVSVCSDTAVMKLFASGSSKMTRTFSGQSGGGRHSGLILWASRMDRLVTKPLEIVLDWLGFGFILTISAVKERDHD